MGNDSGREEVRVAREAAERAAQEAVEAERAAREAREAAERAAQEAVEAERAAREAREAAERAVPEDSEEPDEGWDGAPEERGWGSDERGD